MCDWMKEIVRIPGHDCSQLSMSLCTLLIIIIKLCDDDVLENCVSPPPMCCISSLVGFAQCTKKTSHRVPVPWSVFGTSFGFSFDILSQKPLLHTLREVRDQVKYPIKIVIRDKNDVGNRKTISSPSLW